MDTREIDDCIQYRKTYTVDGLVTKGDILGRKSSSRCVSVFLGLLCVFLLAANVGQFFYNNNLIRLMSAEKIQAGAAENIVLEGTLTNMTEDKDQLQKRYNTLKQEKDNLQTQLSTMTTNRDNLQRSNSALRSENDQLQRSKDSLQRDRDQLQIKYNSVVNDRNELQKKIDDIDKPCESGWKKFGCRCFYISTLRKSWDNSRDYCISQGAQLAIIDNNDKQVFLNGAVKSSDEPWFGLSDRIHEGHWNWVDGRNISTTAYWAPGRPDSHAGDGEDCAEFWPNSKIGSWNDEPCTSENTFICEKTL